MRLRFRGAVRAAIFGWIAGWLVVLPFQLLEAIRNAGFDVRLFGEMVALSVALWTLLTFAVSCYCCCFFLLPVVWLLSPGRIVAHRTLWTSLNTLFGFALMALRSHVWTAFGHDGVGTTNFWVWALFASAFFGVAAEAYGWQMRKAVPATPSSQSG
jgi:hypothetical protein